MKKITLENYQSDKYYPKIVRAVSFILEGSTIVEPVKVFEKIGLLSKKDLDDWYHGRYSCLEMKIQGSLAKLSRILRILRFHAHDLNLVPFQVEYFQRSKGPKKRLNFTKYRDKKLEEAYQRNFRKLVKVKKGDSSED